MSRIALIAPTGMLGSAVYGVLRADHELVLAVRDTDKLKLLDEAYGGVADHPAVKFDIEDLRQDFLKGFPTASTAPALARLTQQVGQVDAVVNCAGIIKPYSLKDPTVTLFVNGAFPHLLAAVYGSQLIQITTDCAFSGLAGAPYTEESPQSPNDLYGLSKAIGEPAGRALVLRTSIIGPELHSGVSLIAWVRSQAGQEAKGFTRHQWNGITTKQFGQIVHAIVTSRADYPDHGLFHVFGSDVSKYDMVKAIAAKYDVDLKLTADDGPVLDRRLRTVHDLNARLKIPSFEQMLADL